MSITDGLQLHLLAASGRLEPRRGELESQIAAAFGDAVSLLDLRRRGKPVDVVVRDAPRFVIPEIGVGGVAPDAHTIFLSLDPMHPRFDLAVRRELGRTLAHELHHVARRRAGCRGNTLWAAIVHEGLADHFSVELYGGEPPLWANALSPPDAEALTRTAVAQRDSNAYDHGAWFVGGSPEAIPRWAGYAIGWHVVGKYLEAHPDRPASQLIGLPAECVASPSHAGLP